MYVRVYSTLARTAPHVCAMCTAFRVTGLVAGAVDSSPDPLSSGRHSHHRQQQRQKMDVEQQG